MTTNSNDQTLAGLILAAGMSRRMGAFKPLLPIGGQPMLRRAIDSLRAAGVGPVVVVTGYRGDELAGLLAEAQAERVHNGAYAETHMLDSIRLGLRALQGRCGQVLIAPADNPLMRVESIQALLAAKTAAARPVYQGKPGHPVLLRAGLFPWVLDYAGPGGLRGALEASGQLTDVAVDDPGADLDADRPEDYQRLLDYYAAQPKNQEAL